MYIHVDISIRSTEYKYRPRKRKLLKKRSLINDRSACLVVVHAVVVIAMIGVTFLNKLDPMVGLSLGVDLALLALLPKLVIYQTSGKSARPSL